MPSSTRSNKEQTLLFSDPSLLEPAQAVDKAARPRTLADYNMPVSTRSFSKNPSIEEEKKMHRFGSYPLIDVRDNLVRQALATAEIIYEDIYSPTFKNASFTFMAAGKFCSFPLMRFNEVYNLADDPREIVQALLRKPVSHLKPKHQDHRKSTQQHVVRKGSDHQWRTTDTVLRARGSEQGRESWNTGGPRSYKPGIPSHGDVLRETHHTDERVAEEGSMWKPSHSIVHALRD
ncbi:hypothetical protein DY000_02039942 [Brassica cretica]|uniref:Uncharacterized protein n=1 Tax=Brassica cretica TaxID=69181 RepID=A0ABQ7BL43_BRACR|nr:hypothetical protein DY000_02039942 [Brassica cretica]